MSKSRARRPSPVALSAIAFIAILAIVGYWRWIQEAEEERDTLRGLPPDELSRMELVRGWVRRGADSVPEVIEALADEGPMIRRSAARALNQIGPEAKDAIPAIREALADPDEDVRSDAAAALLSVSGPSVEVVEEICVLLSDRSVFVRREMVRVLREAGPSAIPAMLERARGPEVESRLIALEVLRPMIKPRSALAEEIDSPDDTSLAGEPLNEIVEVFRQLSSEDDQRIRTPARIMLANADKATIDELRLWIADPAEDVSTAALDAIEEMGPAGVPALPELVSCLQRRIRRT